ncbi:helix-turn-helix domain-containing protein [Paucibacter sp. Y2R2-4]|uniref:helix-turn-helix domain-containing protein n=1 Tax=Paucibacter sp. Y2R2-4 TaxID=2893553 RepID=UPI0021E4228B|nr:helix-turn-helix domain-containing protein [Paucibacter sp. Y2R2-4]MCV2352280.1 helix-turn-helix domain-containing protein [Paucibacter sp. Y2R2-4]
MRDSRAKMVARQRRKEQSQPAPVIATAPERIAFLHRLYDRLPGVELETQEQRLLLALMAGPLTTREAYKHLDMADVTARVRNLRKQGYQIETTWVRQYGDRGALHRFGQYSLTVAADEMPGGEKGAP